jgi:hypothetical protein
MNLKQALKEKNKLKAKIALTLERLRSYNKIEEGFERVYDPHELYKQLLEETDQLIDIKTRIQKANVPILSNIYRLSEVKGLITRLNRLDCEASRDSYNSLYSYPAIGVLERDTFLSAFQLEVEKIQEEIDKFNFVTAV